MKIVPTETRIEIRNLASEVRTDWLYETQMRRVFACCEDREDREHLYAFLLIALATGARKEAIFQLTWDQVYIPKPELERHPRVPEPFAHYGEIIVPKRATRMTAKRPTPLDFQTGTVVAGAYIDFGTDRGNKRRPRIPIGQNQRLMSYPGFNGSVAPKLGHHLPNE